MGTYCSLSGTGTEAFRRDCLIKHFSAKGTYLTLSGIAAFRGDYLMRNFVTTPVWTIEESKHLNDKAKFLYCTGLKNLEIQQWKIFSLLRDNHCWKLIYGGHLFGIFSELSKETTCHVIWILFKKLWEI
jgi:hypothetical protein